MTERIATTEEFLASVRSIPTSGGRCLVGVVGPPGSGKSHLARFLCDALGSTSATVARVLPMDGFHLANEALERLGRRDRKGAPDTFDVDGFVALLDRLHAARTTVYAPRFVREIEEAVAASIVIEPAVDLVIVEGNYLLVDGDPWGRVGARLDCTYYLDTPADVRERRLLDRHRRTYGAGAARRVASVDVPNAEIVERTRQRASAIVDHFELPGEPLV